MKRSYRVVLAEADRAAQPVNVIVVARLAGTRFYLETIESGAFDFIAPPFVATDLEYVVPSALDNVAASERVTGELRRSIGFELSCDSAVR